MKIKSTLLLVFLAIFTSPNSFSQNHTIDYEIYSDLDITPTILGEIDGDIYAISYNKKFEKYIGIYNEDMELINSYKFNKNPGKEYDLVEYKLLKGRIFGFYTKNAKERKKGDWNLYLMEISKTGKVGNAKKIISNKSDYYKFVIKEAPDTSFVMLSLFNYEYTTPANQAYIWDKLIKLEVYYTDLDFEDIEKVNVPLLEDGIPKYHVDIHPDIYGNIHFMASVPNEKQAKGESPLKHTLFTFYNDSEEIYEYGLEENKNRISTAKMVLDKDNNIVFSGLYIDANSDLKGTFLIKANPKSKKIVLEEYNDLDKKKMSFIKNIKSFSTQGHLFRVKEIIQKVDGSIYLIAEGESYGRHSDENGGNYYRVLMEFFVAEIDKNGKTKWWNMIPKRETINDKSSNFHTHVSGLYFMHNKKLNILFLDHKRNVEDLYPKNAIEIYNPYRGVAVSLVTLDEKGNASKTRFFPKEKWKNFIYINSSAYVGKALYVKMSYKYTSSNYKIVKIKL